MIDPTMMRVQIDYGLAQSMASMIAVGTMPGDEQAERAQAALMAIGLMLLNADPTNQPMRDILATEAQGTFKRHQDGSMTITLPAGEDGEPTA